MKKILLVSLVIGIISLLLSCNIFKTEVVEYENEIKLTYDSELSGHLAYDEATLPSYTIKFTGKVNITKQRTGEYECIFSNNDDFFVSTIVSSIIEEYREKNRISFYTQSVEETNETWMNRRDETTDEMIFVKINLKCIP